MLRYSFQGTGADHAVAVLIVVLLLLGTALTAGSLADASDSQVEFMWSGAVTPHSATVKAKVLLDSALVRLIVSDQPDLSSPFFSQPDTSDEGIHNRVVTLNVGELASNTQYYYSVEVNGEIDSMSQGKFRTFPEDTGSFTFAFASCATTGSNHPVFQTIRSYDPLFFFHTGDFHYQNIAVNDRGEYRQAYETVLASPGQSALYRDVPIEYIWDDHDYGPNNSDSTAPGRLAARLTYQEYVPHYDLSAGEGDVPIYHAFTVGRVRFIVCDSRSARSPWTSPDNASKTMLGAQQKAWFKHELRRAKVNYPLIVWVNSLPWIGVTGDDGWYVYTHERKELANFIADNQITNLCMISGDAHMLAIDDGTNSDYSDSGGAAFPVMHAAALDRSGSVKGGPYSHGAYPGGGQFGLMTVIDTEDSIKVHWAGMNYLDQVIVSYSFAFSGEPVRLCGDVDLTGELDIDDVVLLILYTYLGGSLAASVDIGDVDCSGAIDLNDVIYLIGYIFLSGPEPCADCD